MNEEGTIIVEAIYDDTDLFNYGTGVITKGSKKGLVNAVGDIIFEPLYSGIYTKPDFYAIYESNLGSCISEKLENHYIR